MQNKGFVTFVTGSLALICAFYLSFSFVTNHYEKKATEMGEVAGRAYLDSLENEHVWFNYTLKEARNQQIGLGLDLKGGMNVVLKLNAAELVRSLANHPEDANFNKAIALASESNAQGDYIDEFVAQYKQLAPNASLNALFGAGKLRDQITTKSSESDIVNLLKDEYSSAMDASFNVLRTRIDRFGVVAPNLQRLEGQGRILVELPGIKDPARVRELLSRTANLQFWRTYSIEEIQEDLVAINNFSLETSSPVAMPDTAGLDSATIATRMAEYETAKAANTAESFFSLLQVGGRGGATVGLARKADMSKIDAILAKAKEARILREDLTLMWDAKEIEDPQSKKPLGLYELYAIHTNRSMTPDLSGELVTNARYEITNERGRTDVSVNMTMNSEGAQKWARLTKENINRAIAVVLDNVVYSAPNVNSEIPNGISSITGNFSVEEASDLANVLNSGKMETSIVIEQENVVGPTLGSESIRSGIISFAIALVLLMIYMCLAYGLIPGMVANSALIINSFFTMGILASFQAVLTLSGIAGLVLTLGMAVDANVLINERIKEELRAGKAMARAIADGYGNAFSAIFDSNLTTIITGVVLFYFGTGPIRGFATTLIIGLVASFITAVFLTRMIFEALEAKGKLTKVSFTTSLTKNLLVDNNYNILGSRKAGYSLVLGLLVAGLVSLFTIGLNNGIEFSGGRNYIVKFDKQVNNDALRATLAPALDQKLVLTSIGTEGDQVRISTNYKVDEEGEAVEEEIAHKLYDNLKGFYSAAPSFESFVSDSIVSSQKVSPSMSADIKQGALVAVVLALLFMALYILIRFRNVAFSIGAFSSVTATTLMIIALYSLLWKVMPFTMEIDQNFIAAILAVIGYAINDVVIVFDRIREEIGLSPKADRFAVFNKALNATLARTLNTSFTTFLVMAIVFAFGGASMRSFTFVLLLGVVLGTFCTLFIATPIAYEVSRRRAAKQAA